MKENDLSKKYVLEYNATKPKDTLGLGHVMYSAVGIPYGYD